MDKALLKELFYNSGFDSEFIPFHKVKSGDEDWKGMNVLYTSSEDKGLVYKQYIEDIVLALSQCGANVIPKFQFIRANNNKVFMEMLRDSLPDGLRGNISSRHFGCLEELSSAMHEITYPVVIKGHSGASGRNVYLARDYDELKKIICNKIAFKDSLWFKTKEYLRQIKYKGYKRESFYRGKFILQQFIPGLENDWKVYYFGGKAFVFKRPVFPEREFRASGGGYENYKYGVEADLPPGLLDFGWKIFKQFGVPHASLDIAWDSSGFYLLEFQCIYFGTAGILKQFSSNYFLREGEGWTARNNEGNIEKVYSESIIWFLNQGK
jgi:glutathione synthase/RimK-type ligase-like ATP-grasp enzyme